MEPLAGLRFSGRSPPESPPEGGSAIANPLACAPATYPGATNGRLAFGIRINGNTDVYTARPDGQDLRRLTTDPGFDACAPTRPTADSAGDQTFARVICPALGGSPA
jgi:hypothetical protein